MLKYIQFIEQLERLHNRFNLSHQESRLLDVVAKAHLSEKSIFVGDLIGQKSLASQATLHSVFKSLLGKKLLTTKHHKEDGRLKQVVLTKLAHEHYMHIDREINRACNK